MRMTFYVAYSSSHLNIIHICTYHQHTYVHTYIMMISTVTPCSIRLYTIAHFLFVPYRGALASITVQQLSRLPFTFALNRRGFNAMHIQAQAYPNKHHGFELHILQHCFRYEMRCDRIVCFFSQLGSVVLDIILYTHTRTNIL